MLETWKKQFSLKQLYLNHDKPIIFFVSQWQKGERPSLYYLFYRWIIAIIFFVTIVISIVDLKHPDADTSFRAKWLIYLTNWGYTTCTLQALLAAFVVSACVLSSYLKSLPNLEVNSVRLYKFYWVTNTIATDLAFGITTLYWSLIYDENTMDLDAMNVFVHANNSVLMMIDLFVVSHPIRLLHFCYPVVFGLIYAVFNVIFYAAGGVSREGHRYVYTILNWDKPGTSLAVCVSVMGFLVVIHLAVWGLHKLRIWLHSKKLHWKENRDNHDIRKASYTNEGLTAGVV